MSKVISRFNLGYVPNEDRLLFEAVEEDGIRTFWITRRSALMLATLFQEKLGISSSCTNLSELARMNAHERDIVASRSPPKPGKLESTVVGENGAIALVVGVLKTVSLTPPEGVLTRYRIVFTDVDDNSWGFETPREMVLMLQEVLIQQIERVGWLGST
jgi:hypothetical protein